MALTWGALVGGLTAGLAIFAAAWSAGVYVEERYAKTWHLVQVEQRLDYKIADDQLKATQQRLWSYQDRYGQKCERGDDTIQKICRDLEGQVEELRRDVDAQKVKLKK